LEFQNQKFEGEKPLSTWRGSALKMALVSALTKVLLKIIRRILRQSQVTLSLRIPVGSLLLLERCGRKRIG
jgi:hypothetical protein